uniref:ribosomal protein S7 n=1 Tax=Microzonia abyssicola TaxID=217214 RepID=UPI002E7A7B52|nr:ribosomal protein S7 [Syringoderma abyssicola]WBP70365.1 ribosomal protein S7 [Syringoderma abyssicola]
MVTLKKKQLDQFETDPLVAKMINLLMRDGKKSKAENILRQSFFFLHHNYPGQALNIFYLAVFYTQALIGIRLKPRGKKSRRIVNIEDSYIPHFISSARSQTLGIRALFIAGRKRSMSRPLWENLSQEFLEAALNRGEVVESRYRIHDLAKTNKRFFRYRWERKVPVDPDNILSQEFLDIASNSNKSKVVEQRSEIKNLAKTHRVFRHWKS